MYLCAGFLRELGQICWLGVGELCGLHAIALQMERSGLGLSVAVEFDIEVLAFLLFSLGEFAEDVFDGFVLGEEKGVVEDVFVLAVAPALWRQFLVLVFVLGELGENLSKLTVENYGTEAPLHFLEHFLVENLQDFALDHPDADQVFIPDEVLEILLFDFGPALFPFENLVHVPLSLQLDLSRVMERQNSLGNISQIHLNLNYKAVVYSR